MSDFDRRMFDIIQVHEERANYMIGCPMKQEEWQKFAREYLRDVQGAEPAWERVWSYDRWYTMEFAVNLWLDNVLTPLEPDMDERHGYKLWFFTDPDEGKFRISEVTEFFSEEGARQVAAIFLEEKEKL